MCAKICRACAAECSKHTDMTACQNCADACTRCAEQCEKLSKTAVAV
ncbi:MAG: hypothetical protein K2Y32_11975 [Candidatus Obscuribacterales bacterium]|nr:hypothetical protein [Candidatus Obscuribacterales bacterium]